MKSLPVPLYLGSTRLTKLKDLHSYDLQDLWKVYYARSTHFPGPETPNEEIACRLVNHLLYGNKEGLQVENKTGVQLYRNLSPFIASVQQVPDIYIYDRNSELPLCIFEVHSSHDYDQLVCKTIIGVITQLRLLRHFADIDSCIGFTLPKRDKKSGVTRVEVTWTELHFMYSLKSLEADDVKQEVLHAVRSFLPIIRRQRVHVQIHLPYLMRLTDSELQYSFGEHTVQLHSQSSIIVEGGGKIYKFCKAQKIQEFLELMEVQPTPQQTLLPENKVKIHTLTFFVYPVLSRPLTRDQAYNCLGYLLQSVVEALDELHNVLNVAHLDIHLENICFKEESDGSFIAVLIDLDRCAPVNEESEFAYCESCMYKEPTGQTFTNENYDWMQLGWLAVWVKSKDLVDYHQMKYNSLPSDLQNDKFINTALTKGSLFM